MDPSMGALMQMLIDSDGDEWFQQTSVYCFRNKG
jgi:hypothetical protein